jgi:RNA polymerase sigma-70 factor (ECF subfamily)
MRRTFSVSPETDFNSIVQHHGDALSRLAWGYTDNTADHEDLLQDILVALWQALPRFRGESALSTFIFRVATNRALSFVGRLRRHEPLVAAERVPDPKADPEAIVDRRSQHDQLSAAIRRLPELHRQAVILYLEGASVREIASVQGSSENSVAVRLTRARQMLRTMLGEREDA